MNLTNNSKTSTEIKNISSISHQCPFSGGSAVYTARSIIATILPDEEYNDFELCTQEGLMRRANKNPNNSTISISPNPANNQVNINYENSLDPLKKVSVLNIEGTVIKEPNSTSFSINDLSEGIYIVQCKSENGKLYVCKLAVIK